MDRDHLKKLLADNVKIQQLQSSNKTPSVFQMAKNLTSTAVDSVKTVINGNPLNVSEEEANRRKAICNQCEFFIQSQERCSKCGCFMAIKAYLRAATCPVNKW